MPIADRTPVFVIVTFPVALTFVLKPEFVVTLRTPVLETTLVVISIPVPAVNDDGELN